jgi:hypothetical protein
MVKEITTKRKRGYYPYTEDDGYVSSSSEQILSLPSFTERLFDDSIPWYQWKKKSFANPEERVKKFTVPDTESESDDEYWDAIEPEVKEKKADDVSPQDISSESSHANENTCRLCAGVKEAENIKLVSSGSEFQTQLQLGIDRMCDWADKLASKYNNVKRGTYIPFDEL